MKLGLFAINYGTCADPDVAVRVARHAEAAKFESVWTGEHLVLPDPQSAAFGQPASLPFLDTVVALTLVATHTTTIRIGTGIILLPLHAPAVLAKQLASVDVVSRGRLIAGFSAGYLPAEFAASGVPMGERGARMEEHLRTLTALWAMDHPRYEGRWVSIRDVDAHPRPVQRPGPPIVLGGEAPAALRRAATMANGWYGFSLTPTEAGRHIAALRRLAQEHQRPAHLGRLELTVTPAGPLNRSVVAQYQELGVDRLVLLPEPGAERAHRHAPVPEQRILHNIELMAQKLFAGPER
jgi:probable F420-dependent oxidoreductase